MESASASRLSTEADALRAAAAELRVLATQIAASLTGPDPFDREDVWQGAVADAFRARHAAWRAQVTDLWGGPLTELGRTAADWDRRAARLESAAATGPV